MHFKNTFNLPDIETAIEFDTFTNPFPPDDSHHFKQTLFHTESDKWYLFCHVSPISFQNQLHLDLFPHDITIHPFTRDQTFNWLLIHSDIQKIREFFITDPKHSDRLQ